MSVISLGLLLLNGLSSGTHGLANVASNSSRVGLGALAVHWESAEVSDASVRLDVLQALYVARDLSLEVSFDLVILDHLADLILFVYSKVFRLLGKINIRSGQNSVSEWTANAEDCRESNLDSLVVWNGDT